MLSVLLMALGWPNLGFDLGAPSSSSAAGAERAREASDAQPAATIVGEWWTQEKDGRVEFSRAANGTYQGVLRYGIHPRKDVHNPDPKQRERSIIGIVLMWNLRYEDGEYVDGYVYNPEDGETYRMKAWLTNQNSLSVRGFMGIALFGQTHTWSRYR